MITTRRMPRTGRFLWLACALSLAIHLFGGAWWAHYRSIITRLVMQRVPAQQQHDTQVATSDVIHLERRTIPRPARASRAQPAPHPVPVPQHQRARGAPRGAHGAVLSATELAQLNAQFTHTIAASHVDLATIQKQSQERPAAMRPLPMQFTGLQATLQRGEGYITPTTMGQRIGGMVWYYTHYTYMWPDGRLEDDDIPWPFRYPVGNDLFARHIHLIPLQLPPPGFHITRPLKPFLAHFLQTHGAE